MKFDQSPEVRRVENTIEAFEEARCELLIGVCGDITESAKKYFKEHTSKRARDLISDAIDLLTPLGSFKMIKEASKGEKWTGEKLNAKDRLMYVLTSSISFTLWSLVLYGIITKDADTYQGAKQVGVETWKTLTALNIAQKGPEIIEHLADNIPKRIEDAQKIAKEHNMESLQKALSVLEKIAGKEGYQHVLDLMNERISEKSNDNS